MKSKLASGLLARLPRAQRISPPGASPGIVVVDESAPRPVIDILAYGADTVFRPEKASLAEVPAMLKKWPVTWINVSGLGSREVIHELGELFNLHSLALEDVVNLHQRPKVDEYEDVTYIVTRMLRDEDNVETEQVSIFLGKKFVLTFHERAGDCFDPVRDRLEHDRGRIRHEGPDYLAYALIDAIVDGYYPALERYGEIVEELEARAVYDPHPDLFPHIHAARRDLLMLRRAIWPQREMINGLIRDPSPRLSPTTHLYLRDCYDHTVQLLDLTETYRDVAASLFELYLTGVSNRMNEIMKVLTVIATIFIPLGFIASVYGMNFDSTISPLNMPELSWRWGYPYALTVMACVGFGLLFFFWRRGWIGRGRWIDPRTLSGARRER